MPVLRSRTSTPGRTRAGARALWRATGMTDDDFGKPIVAIANSYTQFVPGHVHLKDMGDLVAGAIREAGGVPREFHTIAVDDGIAMGHGGMLYSLPSREVIADAVEYMVNGHAADALVCISNCDKITPGMLRWPEPTSCTTPSRATVLPASIGPPETNTVGMFSRSAAISMPGVILSQFDRQISASAQCALTTYSIESAIRSRLGSE